jgi:bacillithiol biosynthesis cysteine-adding enzyme BshC
MTVAPGLSRLFLDYCSGGAPAHQPGYESLQQFYPSLPPDQSWIAASAGIVLPAHRARLVSLLAAQNTSPGAAQALSALAQGAGVVVTGQQVGLFGGPLLVPLKAATAVARARQASKQARPHVAIFWLATEDHDFAEINNVVFPARRQLLKLVYPSAPAADRPVGGLVLDQSITPLIDQASELLGPSDALDALVQAWQPGRTLAQAFADFYSKVFAAQGLLMLDASGREFHSLGAPVLRAAIDRADELHAALLERDSQLVAAGYHAQVAVAPQSSLLFLIDQKTGARLALKRKAPTAAEAAGIWQAGRQSFSTSDLLGILEAEPERISPSALLRPVFQDYLLSASAIVGGPAEIAYFAQSAVLYQRILGRVTPSLPRFSATLIEPAIGELLLKHELTVDRIFGETADSLAQLLAARAMPIEGKRKIAAAGSALDAELTVLLDWMHGQDAGLGRSAETAASKMRYQMNRLRRLAANFQLQREASLARHAQAISQAIYPGALQERVHGAAFYLARYGLQLAEDFTIQAENPCPGHTAIWL